MSIETILVFGEGDEGTPSGLTLELLAAARGIACLLYTSPSPRDATLSRMPSSA